MDSDKANIKSSLNVFFQFFFSTNVAKIKPLEVPKSKEKAIEYSELFISKENFRCDLSQVTRSDSFRNPSTISRSQSFRSQSNQPSRRPSAMYFNKLSVSEFPRNSRRDFGEVRDDVSYSSTRRQSAMITNKLSVSGFTKAIDLVKPDQVNVNSDATVMGAVSPKKTEIDVSEKTESVLSNKTESVLSDKTESVLCIKAELASVATKEVAVS